MNNEVMTGQAAREYQRWVLIAEAIKGALAGQSPELVATVVEAASREYFSVE